MTYIINSKLFYNSGFKKITHTSLPWILFRNVKGILHIPSLPGLYHNFVFIKFVCDAVIIFQPLSQIWFDASVAAFQDRKP